MPRLPRPAIDGLGIVVRLGLAAVFLVSGALKVVDPAQTRIAVRAYELLPAGLIGPVAAGLPLVELALGTLLVAGAFTRWTALASAVLLVALWLLVRPRTVLSLDGWLRAGPSVTHPAGYPAG